jgi:hypothetical protein
MTETVLKQIVQRAVRDGSFRAQLRSDPNKALAGFGITTEERSALASGDPARLSALGVDQRMSKAFSAGLLSDASKVVASTDATKGVADFTDELSAGPSGTAVIVGDPTAAVAAPATLVHDIQSLSDLHMKLNEQDLYAGTAASTAEVETVRSPMWRIEQDLNVGATGSAAPIDGSPEQSAFESASAAAGTEHSANWRIEQDLDAGASLEAPSASSGAEQFGDGGTPVPSDETINEY